MKEMKIRIKNPEHSKRVQEALFKLGCKWADGSVSVCNPEAKVLYVEDMIITFSSSDNIPYEQAPKYYPRFENIRLPEYHLNSAGEFVEGPEPSLKELLENKLAIIGEGGPELDTSSLYKHSVKVVSLPVNVRSRKEMVIERIKELAEGVKYCANTGVAIPQDWLCELLELNSNLKDILNDESKEK